MKDFAVILSISMKGFVWRWMVALCVFTEIVAAQHKVAPGNERNVARLGTCSASSRSTYAGWARRTCYDIINGNTTSANDLETNCYATDEKDKNPNISVTLRHSYLIHRVAIHSRARNEIRMRGLEVFFDMTSVHNVSDATSEPIYVNRSESDRREARTVTIYRRGKDKVDDWPMINFCELQIYTCIVRKWGPSCDKDCAAQCAECKDNASNCLECKEGLWGANTCANNCSEGCESGNCSFADGTCECREHWEPPNCKSCSAGYWGDNCSTTCPPNCQGPCNKTNGQCDCQPGWKPPKCEGCSEGYWGDSCSKTCGQGCKGSCNKTNGQCECQPGWKPPKCEVTPPPTAASPPSEKKFPIWAAALIALGILGLIALVAFLVWRKRRQAQSPAQAPEGGPNENPEGEAEGEGKKSSRAEQSAEGTEESQQASEGGEAAPAE